MSDNVLFQTVVTATPPDATNVATDDVGGAQYQRIKVDGGGNGVSVPIEAGQQAMAASLPVVIASNQTAIPVTATLTSTTITGNVTVVQPTGTNLHVVTDSGTITTVSAVTAITNALPAGSNVIGHVIADTGSTTAVTGNVTVVQGTATSLKAEVVGTGTFATQSVLTTGSAQIGHLEANQSVNLAQVAGATTATGHGLASGAIRVELPTDGTGIVGIAAGSAVIGHVITDTGSTTAVTGNVTVVQGTGTNLHTVIDSGTLTTVSTVTSVTAIANALPAGSNVIGHVITDSGSTTAVTGTVTISGAVTEATLDAALIAQEATTSGVKGLTAFGAVTTAAPTYTTAKSDALSLTTGGALRSDLTTIAGTGAVTGSGTATGALRVELPTNGTGLVGLNAGTNNVGFVTITPGTTGGWSVFNATSGDGSTALTNSAQAIKASAGTLGGWYIYNPNGAVMYVPIYNVAAASVTVGTTNPLMVLAIPPLAAANLEVANGITFSNAGWSAAAATTAAGNGAPTTALEANFWFK